MDNSEPWSQTVQISSNYANHSHKTKKFKTIEENPNLTKRPFSCNIIFFVKACSINQSRNGLDLMTSFEDEHVEASSSARTTFPESPYMLRSRRRCTDGRHAFAGLPAPLPPAPREQRGHSAIPIPFLRDQLQLKRLIFQTMFHISMEQPVHTSHLGRAGGRCQRTGSGGEGEVAHKKKNPKQPQNNPQSFPI